MSSNALAFPVLIASTEVRFRESIVNEFSLQHLPHICAAGGAEALTRVESSHCRMVIVDPRIPDLNAEELVKQLEHNQDTVRLLAIKFLALAGPNAKEAIPALERMNEDPNTEVRKQAQAASERIKSNSGASQAKGDARKTAA